MTDMVEHSSQNQDDGEYYRKMDVRLGHARRGWCLDMLNLGVWPWWCRGAIGEDCNATSISVLKSN